MRDPVAQELSRLDISLTLANDRQNLPEGMTPTRAQETAPRPPCVSLQRVITTVRIGAPSDVARQALLERR